MANNSGKQGTRRLPDLGVYPEEDRYRPPSCPPAEEFPFPAELAPGHLMYYRPRIYRGKVVDFALQQMTLTDEAVPPGDGDNWVQVARIDCCRAMVHRHQYNQAGVDIFDHRPIRSIPKEGWDIVNQAYEESIDVMLAEWIENVERWRNGS